MATASTTDRRRALADMVRERSTRGQAGRGLRWTVGVVLAIILALLLSWLRGFFVGTPREVLEIRSQVDAQIAALRQAATGGQFAIEPAGFEDIMDRVRDLPEETRRQAGREIGRLFEAREEAEADSYFNLPPERRQDELDRRIKADEARRQAREEARAQRARSGPADPAGAGRSTGGPPPSGRRGRSTTEEQRNAFRKAMIDRTSPQERARRTEYRRQIDERRKQLGLPTRGGR